LGELISTYDACEDGEEGGREPPANGITKEIDLLASFVLSPKAYAAEEERPLEGLTGVWMAAREGVVMEEHGTLEFEPFLEEGDVLDFAGFYLQTLAVGVDGRDLVDIPDVA
jgi:hypothetical protein